MSYLKFKSTQVSFCYIQVLFACVAVFIPGCSIHQPEQYGSKIGELIVPVVSSEYIYAYNPQGDVFPGPDTKNSKAGEYYPNWQPNDHCFIKGPDSRWHAFGITHPATEPGERVSHDDEFVSFHAVSPGDNFEYSFREDAWADKPKVLPPSQRPGESVSNHAPTIVKHNGLYKMIYGPVPFRMAVSEDLYQWDPKGQIKINEKNGRDPSLMLWDGIYYLTYCSGNAVRTSTSKDLPNWTEPVEIFKGEVESYQCESPHYYCITTNSIYSGVYGTLLLLVTGTGNERLFIVPIIHWIFTDKL